MKKLLFIVNPKSGKGQIKNEFYDVIELFSKKDYEVTVHITKDRNDARDTVCESGGDYDIIVCAGGDGTLDEVVCGIIDGSVDTPIGYIPAGTTNDFANSLNIPVFPYDAAKQILDGEPCLIDAGKFNNDYFVYIAAFGAFTSVSYSTSQEDKNFWGYLAYLVNGIKSMGQIKEYDVRIEFDDTVRIEGKYVLAMVSNSKSIGGIKNVNLKDASFDDGLFEVTLVKGAKNVDDLIRILSSVIRGDIDKKVVEIYKVSKIRIESDEDIDWTLDGDYGGAHKEVVIKNLHRAVSIMCDKDRL